MSSPAIDLLIRAAYATQRLGDRPALTAVGLADGKLKCFLFLMKSHGTSLAMHAYSLGVRWRAIPSSRSSGAIPSSLASVGAISTVLAGSALRSPLHGPQKMMGTRRS